jgi:type I restriction enzyme S subunit
MNWPLVQLGDLIEDITAGKSFGASNAPAEEGHWGIIKVSAMTWGKFKPEENKAVPAELADPRFEIREGDLLVSRANTAEYVGASVLVRAVRPKLLLSDKSLRLTPKSSVHPEWLWYTLQAPAVRGQIRELATGTKDSMRNISQSALRRIQILIPPLDEQRHIVVLLDDHLSRLDAAQAGVGISIKRLAALRQATLVAAIREAQSCGDCTRIQLGDLADVTTGMTPLKSNKAYYDGGTIPWITSGDLHRGAIDSASQFVTDKALAETSLKLIPAGAILVAMYGEGKTRGTAADLTIEATTNQACAAVVLKDHSLQRWVRLVLDANYDAMRRLAAGGVQPNLNLSLVRAIEIPIPPPIVRSAILSRVADIDAAIGELKDSLGAASVRGTLLRQSLLTAAFSGRLTPARQHLDTEDLVSP